MRQATVIHVGVAARQTLLFLMESHPQRSGYGTGGNRIVNLTVQVIPADRIFPSAMA